MKKNRIVTVIVSAILLCLLSGTVFAAHTPKFSWRIRGDANYEQWIYDGEEPIAMFDAKTLDEPMQRLMMFGLVPKPLFMRHLKLEPGGKPLVSAVHLFWKTGTVVTDILEGLEVSGDNSDRLTVVFTVKDPWDTIRIERTLTVTYDNQLESYVYDLKDNATVLRPETLHTGKSVRFEICDPWFNQCPAASQRFQGMWKGRYQQFAYEDADGGVTSIPHHHVSNPQKGGIRLKRDGYFAAVYEPDGNPVIQLMGDTAEKTTIGICPWAYDVHLGFSVDSNELYAPIRTHFRFFKCPDAKAKQLDQAAKIPIQKTTNWGGLTEFPVYEPNCTFDKSMSVNKKRETELDYWFWIPQGEEGAVWDKSSGRNDSCSLKIEKDTTGLGSWYSMCEGQGYWALPWTPCKGYEVSCWVKTENVKGPGSSIGIRCHVPNVPPEWPITQSKRISGTNGWTKLTVTIGPPPDDTSIVSLHLNQSGSGTTWFDDLEVKMLK